MQNNCKFVKVLQNKNREEQRNHFTGIIFRMIMKVKRLSNYKSAHKSIKTKNKVTNKLFQRPYIKDDCEGKEDN